MFNITNYSDHPTRIGYTVFKFREIERAEYFETLLKKENIWYETSFEDDGNSLQLFGIKKGDFKMAMNANYLVSAKYRKKFIPNFYIGWMIIIVSLTILTLAIIGAIIKT